jgi:hypothetical protein
LWNCDCGSSKFVFCNSATLRSLRQVLLLSRPFFSAQDGFKNIPKIFIESFVTIETKNFPERDNSLRILVFHESTPYGYSNSKVVPWGLIPCGTQTIFYLGDSLIMDPFSLGYCSFYMQTNFRKYPFKGTGKLSNLFDMILWSHE